MAGAEAAMESSVMKSSLEGAKGVRNAGEILISQITL
jgi:hypothetical protein